jgi:deazaflavin-dependent oxidoreductase (nitroreductase family)
VSDMADFNAGVIDEFRANGGRVGGQFEGAPLLLLTSIGAKSGAARTTPLMYLADGERIVIFASKAGAPSNPAWYHNLVANRSATVEVGGDVFDVDVSVAEGEERERLYNQQAELTPQFADYAQKTTRRIPVVVLERAADE